MRVRLFGHVRIESTTGPIQLPTKKAKLLLAYLLLYPEAHSRERLAARFWLDAPEASARASLRNALSTLRRALGHELFRADRETVQIDASHPVWVDALALRAQAERFLDAPSLDPSTIDVGLYRGELLVDYYDEWVIEERDRLRALYLEALVEGAQRMRSQSEYERAIELAERALACDRAHERAHQHLMFCHVALGNRDAALRQYRACESALRDELAVEPSAATNRLHEWARQTSGEAGAVEVSLTNLPIPLTSFVGRQREMATVTDLLSSVRLLTLTGVGGSGKTRLAIQVAIDRVDAFRDGVWWVELAALAEAELLPRQVAKALGIPEVPQQPTSDTLASALRSKELLLVLDNCEHLTEACARLVSRLLRASPNLVVLATSREMLGIDGEQVWPVAALSVPAPDHRPPADELLEYESIRLFVRRATAVSPGFTVTASNAAAVVEICRRLEGLPLAIELAAARVKVLTAEQIAGRLDDAFNLLTSGSRAAAPRHQTLRAAIDWSYDLLPEKEQVLLRRLSVFAGGWTLPAAEAVCAGGAIGQGEVLDLLARLVEKSLVESQARGKEARFRMLRTIRRYAGERLLESSESGPVRRRHLEYFLRLAEAAAPHLGYFLADRDARVWLGRLEVEQDNLRAAVRWVSEERGAAASDSAAATEAALRLAVALHWYWFAHGRFSEGRSWLTRLLDAGDGVAESTRARALLTAGYLACWQGEFAAGGAPLREALDRFRRREDAPWIAFALHGLGFVALGEGQLDRSRSRFEEALEQAREAGDRWLASFASHFLAIALTYQEQYAAATAHFEEGNALLEEMGGHRGGVAFSLFHLGRIARLLGEFSTSTSRYADAMAIFQQTGDRRGIGYCLSGFAILAAGQGDADRAAVLSGAVESLQAVLGPFLEAPLQIEYDRELAAVRAGLGDEAFGAAVAAGRAMSVEQAVAYALKA